MSLARVLWGAKPRLRFDETLPLGWEEERLLLRKEKGFENEEAKREVKDLGMWLSSGRMTGRQADTMPMLHSTLIQMPAGTIVPIQNVNRWGRIAVSGRRLTCDVVLFDFCK